SLRAAINFYEFRYREADYGQFPKGLMYGLRAMSSWLHDDLKPFLHLKDNAGYAALKEKIGTGYFEKMLKEYLLENTHSSLVILKPQSGLSAKKEEELKKKLAAFKAGLSQEQIRNIVADTKHLKQYQEEPSTKEELEKIPLLSREDIDTKTQPLYNDERTVEGIKVIHHNVFTNGIAYLRLLFSVKDIPKDLLPYASMLSFALGYVDTQNYSYLELSNEINIHTGGISNNIRSFSIKGSTNEYYPVFEFNTKALYDKIPDAFRLIEEIIYRSKLDDTKRLKEIIEEGVSKYQMHFNSAGHSVAMDRAMSYYSVHGLYKEITTGISFYKFLENLAYNFGQKSENLISKMKELMNLIFTKDNLMVSITADEEGLTRFAEAFPALSKCIVKKADNNILNSYDQSPLIPQRLNEGFKTAMQVQYVARTGNFFNAGYKYNGALKVLKTILSYDYLWNNVRVKGGAYGCMCGFSGVDGDVYFTSYRDPNLRETNQIYEKIADYVKNFTADERDITKYIIGTFSSLDAPLTPQSKGKRSLSMYIAGISEEELQREREEILNVTEGELRSLGDIVKAVTDEDNICVIGNESKINENKDMFKEVKNLFK
ncbi:MAG TPA: insulinase family protein, partial [Mobilitalea sp.]|nr:insulinase family protein [Mobilitalea sp.]